MKLLIDTHVALWLFNDHESLSQTAKKHLLDEENELYISIVSAWEIAIKHSLGKLTEFPDGVKLLNVFGNFTELYLTITCFPSQSTLCPKVSLNALTCT